MESDWVDFRAVKASVTILQVLDHYGIRLRKVNATYLRGKCPLPTHSSPASGNSFGVDLQKQAWACHSDSCVKARGGRSGGNVLDFVAIKESLSIREAAIKLSSWFGIVSPQPTNGAGAARQPEPGAGEASSKPEESPREGIHEGTGGPNKPLTFSLKGIDPGHPYLKQRGISEEVARFFGVGYFAGNGSMAGRIVFPIRNRGGNIVAYAGRSIDDSEPRWKLPTGFRKSLELFGIHAAAGSHWVAVVESFWGVLALHQAGVPAVALMGRSMSNEQQELLASLGSTTIIVVLLDGDEPGRSAAPEIALRLARQQPVRIIELPTGKQPDQFTPEELRALLAI